MKKYFLTLIALLGLATTAYALPTVPSYTRDWLPETTSTYYLGSASKVWKGLWADTATTTDLVVTNATTTNLAVTNALTLAPVVIQHKNGTLQVYNASADTNLARGTALKTAVTASVAGDTIYLAANTYDIGDDAAILFPDNVSLRGSGKYTTIIESGATHHTTAPTIQPGDNSEFADLTIWGTDTVGYFQYPFGLDSSQAGATNVRLTNVRIINDTDAIIFYANSPSSIVGYGVELYTKWDAVRLLGGTTQSVILFDSIIETIGQSSIGTGQARGISVGQNGVVECYNCKITSRDGTVAGYTTAIFLDHSSASVSLYSSKLTTSSAAGSVYDIYNQAGGTVNIDSGTSYDTTKTFGTLTYSTANPVRKSLENSLSALTGIAKLTSGVISTATVGTDYDNFWNLTGGTLTPKNNENITTTGDIVTDDLTANGQVILPEDTPYLTTHDMTRGSVTAYYSNFAQTDLNTRIMVAPATYLGYASSNESHRADMAVEDGSWGNVAIQQEKKAPVGGGATEASYQSFVWQNQLPASTPSSYYSELNFRYTGWNVDSGDGVGTAFNMNLYVYNNFTSSWELLGTGSDTAAGIATPPTITATISSNVSRYVDSNLRVYVMLRSSSAGTGDSWWGNDYVNITFKLNTSKLDNSTWRGNLKVGGDFTPEGAFYAKDTFVQDDNVYFLGSGSKRWAGMTGNIVNAYQRLNIGAAAYGTSEAVQAPFYINLSNNATYNGDFITQYLTEYDPQDLSTTLDWNSNNYLYTDKINYDSLDVNHHVWNQYQFYRGFTETSDELAFTEIHNDIFTNWQTNGTSVVSTPTSSFYNVFIQNQQRASFSSGDSLAAPVRWIGSYYKTPSIDSFTTVDPWSWISENQVGLTGTNKLQFGVVNNAGDYASLTANTTYINSSAPNVLNFVSPNTEIAGNATTTGKIVGYKGVFTPFLTATSTTERSTFATSTVTSGTTYQTNSYAEIYVADGSTAQSIPTGTTYTKMDGWTTNSEDAGDVVGDVANDQIIINRPGVYSVNGSFSFSGDISGSTVRGALFYNGVEQDHIHWIRKLGAAGDVGSASFTGFFTATTTAKVAEVRLRHDQAGSENFTPMYANLNIRYLGE